MPAFRDLAGQTFGRLTVLQRGEDQIRPSGRRLVIWRCQCVCGAEAAVRSDHLTCEKIQSCGCWRRDQPTKHGGAYSKEYNSWGNAQQRCDNPNNPGYDDYGGRGITFCDRWRKFENFLADMGECPDPDFSIERQDNDRGYEPGNCKWASTAEQNRNRCMSTRNTSGVTGVVFNKARGTWHAQIGVNRKMIHCGDFEEFDEAVAARQAAAIRYGFAANHGNPRTRS